MNTYGIPYQGSKSKIADDIIKILPKGERFVDLLGGGAAMTHCALLSGKYKQVYYNELNPLLCKLLKDAVDGKYNPSRFKPEWISREDFFRLKDKDGYVKYIWSFGNDGRSYLFGKEIEPIKRAVHEFVVFGNENDFIKKLLKNTEPIMWAEDYRTRRLQFRRVIKTRPLIDIQQLQQLQQLERLERLQQLERLERLEQLERLERLEINCGDYRDYTYKQGDVVYCDPPYNGTKGYGDDFDFAGFLDWIDAQDYPIYFSSYDDIQDDRFRIIWQKEKLVLMSAQNNRLVRNECIYIQKRFADGKI